MTNNQSRYLITKTPQLIGLVGRKYSGKDTLGDYIVSSYNYNKIAFADPLKQACKEIFGFNDAQLYGDQKESIDEYWNITPREVYQFVGTELFRNQMDNLIKSVGSDMWVKVLEKKILDNKTTKFVITDVRFKNEAEMIKKNGGFLIKLKRNTQKQDSHISETELDEIKCDYEIINNGSLEDLYDKFDLLFCDYHFY